MKKFLLLDALLGTSVLLKGLLVQWAPKRVVVRRMTLSSVYARKDWKDYVGSVL